MKMIGSLVGKSVLQTLLLTAIVLILFSEVAFTGRGTFLGWYDNSVQYHPWMTHLIREWRSGHIPLWDFGQLSGTSFVGEWQTGVFYPVNIAYAFLVGSTSAHSLDLLILVHIIYGAIGAMLLFKRLGLAASGALLGALILTAVGPVEGRALAQANIFVGLCHIPWVLYLMQGAIGASDGHRGRLYAAGAGLVLGICCLAGHPQPFIHGTFLLFIWTLFADSLVTPKRPTLWYRISCFGIAMGFAFLIGFIQIAASAEYFHDAYRWVGLSSPISGLSTVPYKSYVIYALRWKDLVGLVNPSHQVLDVGSIAITLTALAFSMLGLCRDTRLKWLGLGLSGFGILVALGDCTFFGPLIYHTPWLNKVREPSRALLFFQVGAALLAALGVDLLIKRWGSRWPTAVALSGAILLAFVGEAHWQDLARTSFASDDHSASRFNAPTQATDLLEKLTMESCGQFRVYVVPKDILPPNLGDLFQVRSATGHSSSMNQAYFKYLSKDWSLTGRNWDELGVRYVASNERPPSGFKELAEFNGIHIYERPGAKPIIRAESGADCIAPVTIRWAGNSVGAVFQPLPEKCKIVMGQILWKGWHVTVNGRKQTLKTREGLMSVMVPSGPVEVRFFYRPSWLYCGFAAWGVAALSLGFLWKVRRPTASRVPAIGGLCQR